MGGGSGREVAAGGEADDAQAAWIKVPRSGIRTGKADGALGIDGLKVPSPFGALSGQSGIRSGSATAMLKSEIRQTREQRIWVVTPEKLPNATQNARGIVESTQKTWTPDRLPGNTRFSQAKRLTQRQGLSYICLTMSILTVRISDDEKAALARRAKAEGISTGALVRRMIQEKPLTTAADLLAEIEGRMGDKRLAIKKRA